LQRVLEAGWLCFLRGWPGILPSLSLPRPKENGGILKQFSEELFLKPQILVASKVDHPEAEQKFAECRDRLREIEPNILSISSITGLGVRELVNTIRERLERYRAEKAEGIIGSENQ